MSEPITLFSEEFQNKKHALFDKQDKEDLQKYCLKNSEYLYYTYLNDQSAIPISIYADFQTLRLYARGNQPVEKYLDVLTPKNKGEKERKSFMNISKDILPIIPKFRNVFLGMFNKIEHDVTVFAVNERADEAKNNYKFSICAEKELKAFHDEFEQKTGMSVRKTDMPFVPETIAELDMYMSFGGFKLKEEIAIKMFLDETLYISNWKDIKTQIFEDAFDVGLISVKEYIEPVTKKIKGKYIDPQYLIAQYSRSNTFDNIRRAGNFEFYTISQLRETGKFSEDELLSIAQKYQGLLGNAQLNNFLNQYDYYQVNGVYIYDLFKIIVLENEWFNDDTITSVSITNKYGNTNTTIVDDDYSKKNNENRKVKKEKLRKVYEAKWIVGSDIVFDYGLKEDVAYPPKLSYHIYKIADKSAVSTIIPIADNMQLSWMRFQNAQSMARPAGVEINIDMLKNISMGGKGISEMDVLKIFNQMGHLLYSGTTHHSKINNQGSPIKEMEGGLGRQLNEFITTFDFNLKMMQSILGINDVAAGENPRPGALVGTSEIAINATTNSLQPVYNAYISVKERFCRACVDRLQVLAKFGDITIYDTSIGKVGTQVIVIGKDINQYDYALRIELKPTDEDKKIILNAALESLKSKRQGGAGIKMSDFMFVKRQLQAGNSLYAESYLAYKEEQSEKEKDKSAEKNMQQNSQIQQETEKMKQQIYAMQKQIDLQHDVALETKKTELEMQVKKLDEQLKEQEIRLKGNIDAQHIVIKEHMGKEYAQPTKVNTVEQ